MQHSTVPQDEIRRHESYLESDAHNLPLRLALGDLYHRAGRLDEAMRCYEQCLRQQPGYAPARSRIASVLITRHRFAEAEQALREVLAGEGDAAGEAVVEGADAGAGMEAVLHNLGLALYFQQRWDEALACFDGAAARGLTSASNDAYRARTLHHLARMPEAIEAARAWAAQARDVESRSYLALLYTDGDDPESGRRLALEVLAEDPEDTNANVVQGLALTERQDMQKARRHFETALRRDAVNGRAWLGLGLACLHEQDHAHAIDALQRAVRIFPRNAGTIVALGWAQLSARQPDVAEETFRLAVQADGSFGESHGGLAAALAMQNRLAEAETEIQIAKRLDRRGFGAEFARSAVLALGGDQQRASTVMANLLKQAPHNSATSLMQQLRVYSERKPPPAAQQDAPRGPLQ